jgi:Mg/Co/Ni transporter MgtE
VHSCEADDDVQLALKTMVSENVPRIPVVDHDRKLVGMLSIGDLLEQSEGQPNHEQVVNAATSIQKGDSTRAREHNRAVHRTGLLRTIFNLVLGPVSGGAERIQPL